MEQWAKAQVETSRLLKEDLEAFKAERRGRDKEYRGYLMGLAVAIAGALASALIADFVQQLSN